MIRVESFLNATKSGKKPFPFMKDVAKRVSIPRLDLLSEIHEGKNDIIRVSIPRFSNEVWEGRIVKPHRFKMEGVSA